MPEKMSGRMSEYIYIYAIKIPPDDLLENTSEKVCQGGDDLHVPAGSIRFHTCYVHH